MYVRACVRWFSFVTVVMSNCFFQIKPGYFLNSWATMSFSRRTPNTAHWTCPHMPVSMCFYPFFFLIEDISLCCNSKVKKKVLKLLSNHNTSV